MGIRIPLLTAAAPIAGRSRPLYRRCALAGLILAVASSVGALPAARAQEPGDSETATFERLFRCVDVSEDALRVQCYDAVVQPLADTRVPPEFEQDHTVYAFAGRDDYDTQAFTIEKQWRARWIFEGSILTIELRLPNGELVDIVGNQIGAGHGNTDLLAPGSYQLAVRAIGKWQLAVEPE